MQIPIFQIKVNEGRRGADQKAVQELADSISRVGLLNPITVDQGYNLIAGLHRLEAAKRLGWVEIKCTVSSLEGLQATLAEIDENFIHKALSDVEFRDLLLRRKEIYENLHPETKVGIAQATAMNKAMGNNVMAPSAATLRTFVDDTADKLGMAPRTVREELQIAKNLTPEAKKMIQDSGTKIKKKDTIKLSRLAPEQQQVAVRQLVSGDIKSMDEYRLSSTTPSTLSLETSAPSSDSPAPIGYYATIRDSVADLKNPDKDRSPTPDIFLTALSFSIQRFCQNVRTFSGPEYESVFPVLTQEHLDQIYQELESVHSALNNLYYVIERMAKNEKA